MAVKRILTLADKELLLPSDNFLFPSSESLTRLVLDMEDTMYEHDGIGLAAIQIGIPYSIVLLNNNAFENKKLVGKSTVLINPSIVSSSGRYSSFVEGCLSIPNFFASVSRPKSVRVRYYDLEQKRKSLVCSGLLAVCLQHEIDHIKGKVFINYLSKEERERAVQGIHRDLNSI